MIYDQTMSSRKSFLSHPIFATIILLIAIVVAYVYLPKSSTPEPVNNAERIRVLFVGNSYTKYNNLRGLFAALAKAGDKNVIVGENIILGSQLSQHLPKVKNKKLLEQGWDFVVLQEQSLIPAVEKLRTEKMIPTLQEFDKRIRSNDAQPVLFMTWGRKEGAAGSG